MVTSDESDSAYEPPEALADKAIYIISVAAQLTGMHPQTLRQYDRLGLVCPHRTRGRGRRYSADNIDMLREIQRLSHDEGINLAGISRIIGLQTEVKKLRRENELLRSHLERMHAQQNRVFAADTHGDVQTLRRGMRPMRSSPAQDSLSSSMSKGIVLRQAYSRALTVVYRERS